MPRYDYRCKQCEHTFIVTYASFEDVDDQQSVCPSCGSADLDRLIKRVAILTSEEKRLERLADPSRLAALEDEDPQAMGQLMREMAAETGEDPGKEFNEVIDRLESGESPESIEQSMDLSDFNDPPGL